MPWDGHATDRRGKRHWVGVDWDRRRIGVVGKGHRYRELPICPRLHTILLDAFQDARDGSVTATGLTTNNLTRQAQRHARAADVAVWPKFFQAMRSSCENEWKQGGVAEPTYCAWMGHSSKVSREHYVSPTESEFDSITQVAA